MDDPSLIKDMAERGAALAIETFPLVRSRFLDGFFCRAMERRGPVTDTSDEPA